MRVALSWLTDYVDCPETPERIAHDLTMSGTNIESVTGDVLEAEITPNRGDCISVVGVAREIAAMKARALRIPAPRLTESGEPAAQSVTVTLAAPDLCPRYTARLLRNVKNGASPHWLQDRLLSSGLRPINLIVDVTNYVMLELGQPLHAFDFTRVRGGAIHVRRATDGERFVTLDGQERTLDSSILVIADGEATVAVAGIMGGEESGVTEATTTVLLESAHFDAVAIRAGARRLGMNTDASYRFERGVDPNGTVLAVNRAAQLLQELAGAEVASGVVDAYPRPIEPRVVTYRPARGDKLIGRDIAWPAQKTYLERLGMTVADEGDTFDVTVPTFRPDITQEDDVVEEVARLSGYEKIPYRLPGGGFMGKLSPMQAFGNRVRAVLLGCGLQECLTHSLADPALLMRFSDTPPIRVRTPLSEEYAGLRTSLMAMLVGVADRNARHGRDELRLFEVGQVFLPPLTDAGVTETQKAAGLLCGSPVVGRWNLKPAPLQADFYAAKGVVEALLDALCLPQRRFEACAAPGLHPGRTARVWIGDADAGIIGQVHPRVQEELGLPGPTYLFELDMTLLQGMVGRPAYRPLPRYPVVSRDLALLIPSEVEANRALEILTGAAGETFEEATLFDVYQGKGAPEGWKSLAFSLRFRSPERTLTDAETDAALSAIRAAFVAKLGARERR